MMARTESAGGGESATTVATFDPKLTPEFVGRIEELQSQIDAIMQKARDDTSPLREDIDEVKKEAHEAGLPRKELNAAISKRRHLLKAENVRTKLTADQQDVFDAMEQALGPFGDTPLGGAAKKKH